ncbi:MAG: DUF5702 domain-containing protein [Mobilitalea sp.]
MRNLQSNKAKGSITVFLSLILLLILSLLCTIIEGARVATARVFADRALAVAMDSLLADYYGPLWEEYHVFGYYPGEISKAEAKKKMEEMLEESMSYTFKPYKDLPANMKGGTELYGIATEETNISEDVSLVEYNGEIMINQAVAYEKYKVAGNLTEVFLDKMSLLETPEKVNYILEEKQKAETELVKIDRGILKLMNLYDGIRTNEQGIEQSKEGRIKVNTNFIKKICYIEITMKNVGINHPDVFQAQQDNYCNPNAYFQIIEDNVSQLVQSEERLITLHDKYQLELTNLEKEEEVAGKLEAIENKSAQVNQSLVDCKESIKRIEATLDTLKEEIFNENKQANLLLDTIQANHLSLTKLISDIKPLLQKARIVIDDINKTSSKAAPLIKEYEELLLSEKESISEELYAGLLEGLNDLKTYQGTELEGYNFTLMTDILNANMECLTSVGNQLTLAQEGVGDKEYTDALTTYQKAKQIMEQYRIDGLTLDYSSLVLNQTEPDNILETVSDLLQGGISSFVIDPDKVSDAVLTSMDQLPSKQEGYITDQDPLDILTDLMDKALSSTKEVQKESIYNKINNNISMPDLLLDELEKAAKKLLYVQYLTDHFGSYQVNEGEEVQQKPSILKYELEYLISGGDSDQENIASVITKIVLVRAVLDFGSILGDKTKRAEAKLLAAALVGFTGLPILVGITQMMLLFAWAVAEALLDTSAILSGKELPIFKKLIEIKLYEIFLISREFLEQKVSRMTEDSSLTFSYSDYLKVFLLTKDSNLLSYRSMDLIQENINLRYQLDNFLLKNCLFGYKAEVNFIIKKKFTSLPFVGQQLNNAKDFIYITNKTYSY